MGARLRSAALCALVCMIPVAMSGVAAMPSLGISGVPATEVVVGQRYEFAPQAVLPDSRPVRFEIENPPGWAAFDATTGRLAGTPGPADVGVNRGIRISVADGSTRASLLVFAIMVVPGSDPKPVSIAWAPPTENTDGSVLTDLAAYRIYAGPSRDRTKLMVHLRNPGLARYVTLPLAAGRHYFYLTAVNTAGAESPPSEIVEALVP
jgi:hypothetical protein